MAVLASLMRLMDHVPLSSRVRLGPEDREAYAFANELRAATLSGRLRAVWTHPANELAGMVKRAPRGKVSIPPQIALARALGLIRGSSDYLFLWQAGSAALEFKSKDGSLTEGQKDFRTWCEHNGVPFYTVRSVAAGLAVLSGLGVLEQ